MRLDISSRKSWSLMDRKTDHEVRMTFDSRSFFPQFWLGIEIKANFTLANMYCYYSHNCILLFRESPQADLPHSNYITG